MLRVKLPNSVFNPEWVDIPRGITIVAGPNNVGKSTLLSSIEAAFRSSNSRDQNTYEFSLAGFGEIAQFAPVPSDNPFIYGNQEWRFHSKQYSRMQIKRVAEKAEGYRLHELKTGSEKAVYRKVGAELLCIPTLFAKKFLNFSPISGTNQYKQIDWMQMAANGADIATVLANLNPQELAELANLVRIVFPEIESLRLAPTSTNGVAAVFARDRGRDLQLSQLGAGIAQAVVLIYTCVFAPAQAIILFDEAFEHLHPRATKEIMRVIHEYSKAYAIFLATHDPAAIRSPYTQQLVNLTRTDTKTLIQVADNSKSLDIVRFLGLENSDLAFAEKVLLGEGATEEAIFGFLRASKLISSSIGINSLSGLGIIGADKKVRRSAFMLTSQILEATSPQKIPIVVIRDRDRAEDAEMIEVEQQANQSGLPIRVFALKRYEIENYFLSIQLLNQFLIDIAKEYSVTLDTSELEIRFHDILARLEMYPGLADLPPEAERISLCKGGLVIQSLCSGFITGFTYKKTDHGLRLFALGRNMSIDAVKALEAEILQAIEAAAS